jgi:predicted phosphodiesterase
MKAAIVLLMTLAFWLTAMRAGAAEPPFVEGSQTLVVLPDTEGYAGRRPQIFFDMMKWVANQQKVRNVIGLLHVGDITNDNREHEWKNARKAFDFIEGKIPYVLAAGNHDYDHTPGRLTHMNEYFKAADLAKWPTFGDVYEKGKLENHYQFLTIHKQPWIVISLEMGPRDAVIDWANEVLAKHKDRRAIILTHGYLYYNSTRYNHLRGGQRATPYGFYGEGADGEMLWQRLVRKHPKVMMVVCGHLSSAYVGYRKDEGAYGNVVHQMLVDYEKMRGGHGFLRLLEFLPDGKTVQVRTYSPVTKKKNPINAKLEEFQFTLQGPTRAEPKELPPNPLDPPYRKPVLRYTFDGEKAGDGATVKDVMGETHAQLHSKSGKSELNGRGQLVLAGNATSDGYVQLPAGILKGKTEAISVEVFFTPTRKDYSWKTVWQFGDHRGGRRGDFLWYCFRTFNCHRVDIIDEGGNSDIQSKRVPVAVGKPLHAIVTYDADGWKGKPLLRVFRDGRLAGSLPVAQKLSKVTNTKNLIGPFAGIFEDFRVYDYAMGPTAARKSFKAGATSLPEE